MTIFAKPAAAEEELVLILVFLFPAKINKKGFGISSAGRRHESAAALFAVHQSLRKSYNDIGTHRCLVFSMALCLLSDSDCPMSVQIFDDRVRGQVG